MSISRDASLIEKDLLDNLWRATNYLTACIITLQDNVLLKRRLKFEDAKKNIDGHWGTCTGINSIYSALTAACAKLEDPPIFNIGTGHAGPSLLSCAFLEGTLSRYYPEYSQDETGLINLCRSFGAPGGLCTEITGSYPGSYLTGGELGNALAVTQGMAFGARGRCFIAVVGDGELETASLQASLNQFRFVRSDFDGLVIPVINANGFRMTDKSNFSTLSRREVEMEYSALGYDVYDCGPSLFELYKVFSQIFSSHSGIRQTGKETVPLIIFRNIKGATGPASLGGQDFEGTVHSHKVTKFRPSQDESDLENLARWLSSYNLSDLFTETGAPNMHLKQLFSSDPHKRILANSMEYVTQHRPLSCNVKTKSGFLIDSVDTSAARAAARECVRFVERHKDQVFFLSPDETRSNHFCDLQDFLLDYDNKRGYTGSLGPARISYSCISVLNENLCFSWQQGLALSGRRTILVSYEAFSHLFASQLEQYRAYLDERCKLDWHLPKPSLNIVLTSLGWTNVPSHHNSLLVDSLVSRPNNSVRLYFPIGQDCIGSYINKMLLSQDMINIMIVNKYHNHKVSTISNQDQTFFYLRCTSTKKHHLSSDKKIVLVAIGDIMAQECLIAADRLDQSCAEIQWDVIAIVDIVEVFFHVQNTSHKQGATFWEQVSGYYGVVFVYTGHVSSIESILWKRNVSSRVVCLGYCDRRTASSGYDRLRENNTDHNSIFEAALSLTKIPYK